VKRLKVGVIGKEMYINNMANITKKMDRVKVCFTLAVPSVTSGITKVVLNIANLLALEEGYEIHLLCVCEPSEVLISCLNEKIVVDSLHRKQNKYSFFLGIMFNIRKYIEENSIQIIIISGMEMVPFYFFGMRRYPISMLAWEHRNFSTGPKFRLEWTGKRIACRWFDGIINITKKDQAMYRKYSSKAKLYQIYNICGIERGNIQYNCDSKKIISVGYLDLIKGFDMLIDVGAKVFHKHPEWTWDIYGKGSLYEKLQKKINDLHMEKYIHLMGYCHNLNDIYKKYSFFVMTSRIEGFGMVLTEAQNNGLPVVSFDIPCGPSDTIINEKNGFLIPPFDIDEMAEKIEMLIDNEKLRKEFSAESCCCHDEMQTKFIVKKWITMLNKVTREVKRGV